MISDHNKKSGITIEEMPQSIVIHQGNKPNNTHTIVISSRSDAEYIIRSLQKMIDYGVGDK